MKYKIHLLRILQERVPRRRYFTSTHSAYRWRWWHLASLRRFLKFWVKHKFGVEVEIDSEVFAAYSGKVDERLLELLSKQRPNYDMVVFILDKTFWTNAIFPGEGLYVGDWICVRHTKSIDYAYLVTVAYRISHELLHWLGDMLGWPSSIWVTKVDSKKMRKTYIGWGRFSIIGHLRYGKPFKVTQGMPKYVTQGGRYQD